MSSPGGCDPAMLELFRAEMDAHVPVLSQGLLVLEKGRGGEQDLEAMMRAAHSIKGAARIVGIEAAVRVSHAMEDCFSAAQANRITLNAEAVDVLLQGVDALQRICSPQPESAMTDESIRDLLDQISAIRDGRPPVRPGSVRPTPAPQSQAACETPTLLLPESHIVIPAVLDESAAESLRAELSDALRRRPTRIRLDFSQVRQFSAAALSLLGSFARETTMPQDSVDVSAEGVSDAMAVLLRITGLDIVFRRSG